MDTFFVYPNMFKDGVREALPKICALLQDGGARIILPLQNREMKLPAEGIEFFGEDDAVQLADAAVVLGGDGTMLRIARAAAARELPLLGINFGHIGFMTELESDELPLVRKLLTGEFKLDERMMLHVAIHRNGRIVYENDALNDVVVAKGSAFRVVRIHIEADAERVTAFNGDGAIISTPTGTTAYALSAGGPIIEPSAENIGVTPICAHALQAKAFVFAPKRRVTICAESLSGGEVLVSVDGGQGFAVRPDDRIEITKSRLTSRLIRLKGNSFYRILQQKL